MHGHELANPSLVIAIALAAGIVAQSVAQHLRIPGIIVLLAAGVLLGPDVAGIIRPDELGDGLHGIVGFAVAVILFEGGLNLELRRLRREAGTIRRLVTIGAVITWMGGTFAARTILGWDWGASILFGSLVIVTGPTVITPILRRIRLQRNLSTILEAEGVFIDAVGAIIAVVALEVVLSFDSESLALGFMSVPTRLVIGAVAGAVGGLAMALLLRVRGVVPEGLENVFTLCLAWAIFHGSNAISAESGIVAVIVAGLVVGNSHTKVKTELKEFKEQLTVMLIGMLFVLLAADVRMAEVTQLGVPGLLVVMALMVFVRPITIAACTLGTSLSIREKILLSGLAPRGIVAAAVASLFYDRMELLGVEGGAAMRGLVFLVIAVTVLIQGGAARFVAGWLGLRRPTNQGYVILGANALARQLGTQLRDGGQELVMIDANPEACHEAELEDFRVLHGNALEERILVAAELDSRRASLSMLRNDGVNLLFARKSRDEYKVPHTHVAIQRGAGAITPDMVQRAGGTVLFDAECDLDLWSLRIRRDDARLSFWRFDRANVAEEERKAVRPVELPKEMTNVILPVVHRDDKEVTPLHDGKSVRDGDEVGWLIYDEREDAAREWLSAAGWREVEAPVAEADPGT